MYSAFITMTFLVMYFITGYLMSKSEWFDHENPAPDVQTVLMAKPLLADDEALYGFLKDTLDIAGRFNNSWTNQGTTYYEYLSVKKQTVVSLDSSNTLVKIKIAEKNKIGNITAYHRMHKYGGPLAYNLYILLMDLASLALLLFVITGVYMWLNLAKYRWLGLSFLSAGFAYTLWVWLTFIFY